MRWLGALLVVAACRDHAAPPAGSGNGSGSGPLDLLGHPTVTLDASLAPGRPFVQTLSVWAPSTVSLVVTHTRGALGPFPLGIFDARDLATPLGHDSMTCERAGCAMRAEIDVSPGTQAVVVRCEATAALDVHIQILAATKP